MRKPNQNKDKKKKIKIERRTGNHYSYYVDANNILKGEWGGFKENFDYGTNKKQKVYGIYYNRYSQYVPINENGFFYNKFDCRKYDGIIKWQSNPSLFISEKNGRFGLLDGDENIILHTVYKDIIIYNLTDNFSIVTTETGKFFYNISNKKFSHEYDDIFIQRDKYERIDNNIYFKDKDKYGVLDYDGNIILPARYNKLNWTPDLMFLYKDIYFHVSLKNKKYYGEIPIDIYDNCFYVGRDIFEGYYITERGGKFGLLSNRKDLISEPFFDEIILYNPKHVFAKSGYHRISFIDARSGKGVDIIFVIARKGKKYWLFNGMNGHCYLEKCDYIFHHEVYTDRGANPYIEFDRNGKHGYVTSGGFILSEEEYDEINISGSRILLSKNGKYGISIITGFEILPCIYDKIEIIDRDHFVVTKNGLDKKVDIEHPYVEEDDDYSQNERPSYGKYAGSYAQDEMGYSDDDIDTIFDGDPSAYWNID